MPLHVPHTTHHRDRDSFGESSPVTREISTPKRRDERVLSPAHRSLRSSTSSSRLSSVTEAQIDAEIQALRSVLQSASYTELEQAFQAGIHKQVGALQLSHLFSTMGLSVSPEAVKEIERRADADANGTLSKQELLDWLDGRAASESRKRLQLAPPSRALERLGLLPHQAAQQRMRQRSVQALSLFDADGDGQVGVDDLRATWKLLLEAPCPSHQSRAGSHESAAASLR